MRAFIQHSTDGLPTNVNTFTALKGFDLLGAEIVPFTAAEVETSVERLSVADGDLLCGYVGAVRRALALLGIPRPHLDS